jgi:MFS transporter, DHA2 family, methylenomycin A resistance protein
MQQALRGRPSGVRPRRRTLRRVLEHQQESQRALDPIVLESVAKNGSAVASSVSERLGAPQTIALASVITAAGCVALLAMASGTSYWAIGAQLAVLGGGLGLVVPPLTSTLLGSVEKSRSGIAAGVLNATRQTGSVLGVALFGSLVGGDHAFIAGAHASLVISGRCAARGAVTIWHGRAKGGTMKGRRGL